ncbi:MAG: SulP family inorganic anion transporter, partial [Proteobacteria bacterium]|nr:SulP family inorganic anion transporter [Pseudomonadota bacterium]
LILILKQIPHAVGLDTAFMGSEEFLQFEDGENTFSGLIRALQVFDLECVLIALTSFGVIKAWDFYSPKMRNPVLKSLPSALLAVLVGLVMSRWGFSFFGLELGEQHRVALPFSGGFSDLISGLVRPDWSALSRSTTYITGLTIAIVGSLESLLSLDAADKIDPERRSSSKNRELLAQGVANSISGFLGGLPITAVIVRTSANVNAGAKTRISGVFHGLWLLIAVVALPGVLAQIPLSVLSVILILVGYKLTKPELYVKMYRKGLDQFIPFLVTIIAILVTDLLKGIAIGMVVGFVFVIKRSHRKSMIMVKDDENNYLIRFMKDISFLHKHDLMLIFRSIPAGAVVSIDGSGDIHVDEDVISLIEDFLQGAELNGTKVNIKKSNSALSRFFRWE